MTRRERDAIARMLESFARFCEPKESLTNIIQATVDLTEANASHVADVSETFASGRLVDISAGLDCDLDRFEKLHKDVIFTNPVVPLLEKSPASVIANSELAGNRAWETSSYLNDFLRGCGVEDATLILPKIDGKLTRYGMGIGHRKGRPVKKRIRKILEWLEPAICQGFVNIDKWRTLARDRELLRRTFESLDEALVLIVARRVHSITPRAERLLGIGTVAASRDGQLSNFAELVHRTRGAGKFSGSFTGRDGRILNLELIDVADPQKGSGTLIRIRDRHAPADAHSMNKECALQLGLTQRQSEVIDLLAVGRGDKEIAYALGMSHSTARVHVREIYARLKVTNRVEAVNVLRAAVASGARRDSI